MLQTLLSYSEEECGRRGGADNITSELNPLKYVYTPTQ